jgi:hypothetical protein
VHVTAPASHTCTTGRVPAVSPDMAEFLRVIRVALRETSPSFVRLYPDCNMAKPRQFEYLLGLRHPRQGYEEEGRFTVNVPSVCDRQVADICLTLVVSKPGSTKPCEMF